MSISKIKENARVSLTGKWWKAACITLAYLAFSVLVSLIIELCGGEETTLGNILDLANSIIQVPIMFGISFAFIKLKRNEEIKAFDFVRLGLSNFGRAWKIGLRELLKLLLPVILMIISVFIIALGIGINYIMLDFSSDLPNLSLSAMAGPVLVGFVLFIVATIWMTVRSLLYSLTTYIAYDNPEMSSLDVVNESARMMKGNRCKIFLLSLSFLGWIIIAAIGFGIGLLWLMPYMVVAEVCFYEYLLGKNDVISNTEENVEAIKEM